MTLKKQVAAAVSAACSILSLVPEPLDAGTVEDVVGQVCDLIEANQDVTFRDLPRDRVLRMTAERLGLALWDFETEEVR